MALDLSMMHIASRPGEPIDAPLGRRIAALAYGVACYALSLATFAYAFLWIGGLALPRHIDSPRTEPLWLALLVNAGLLALFGVQHSVMARPGFKRWWTRIVPEVVERSTYLVASCVALCAAMSLWRPVGGVVWDVQSPLWRGALLALYIGGWLLVFSATFLINHFDLFGLRQVWLYFRGRACGGLTFATPGPYRYVRHPLYVGWLTVVWAAPTMTASHLFFAAVTTAYILIAIRFEERDLIAAHPEYAAYRERTGMLTPRLR